MATAAPAVKNVPGSAAPYRASANFKKDYTKLLQPVIDRARAILLSSATQTTTQGQQQVQVIPSSSENVVISSIGEMVQRVFVGRDLRQPFGQDGVTPLAPYPALLNYYLSWVTFQTTVANSAYMSKRLPEDVKSWLQTRLAQEQFNSNPLAEYSAPHVWVDPKGYKLSDRIWQVSVRTRTQIDALLMEGIRSGRSAVDIAKDLERFLLPTRAALRTKKPYGQDGSFDALRLSRSEITRAHSYAALVSGRGNPFVMGWDFALSNRHPKVDICDSLATIGMSGERIREPYPIDGDVPIPVESTHPMCLCNGRNAVTDKPAGVVVEMRDWMHDGKAAPLTPIDPLRWLRLLLGPYLASLVFNRVSQQFSGD